MTTENNRKVQTTARCKCTANNHFQRKIVTIAQRYEYDNMLWDFYGNSKFIFSLFEYRTTIHRFVRTFLFKLETNQWLRVDVRGKETKLALFEFNFHGTSQILSRKITFLDKSKVKSLGFFCVHFNEFQSKVSISTGKSPDAAAHRMEKQHFQTASLWHRDLQKWPWDFFELQSDDSFTPSRLLERTLKRYVALCKPKLTTHNKKQTKSYYSYLL